MDLFQTTANTSFNSFQDPLNPFNTTRGAWGIDPTYLTPSYAAPYRPQYEGPMGAPLPDHRVGFFRSLYGAAIGTPTNYGDTVTQEDPYYSAIGNRPVDAAMWGAQRVFAPALAYAAAFKLMSAKVAANNTAYSAIRRTWGVATGLGPTEAALSASRMSLGARIGSSVGSGLARGVSNGFRLAGLGYGAAGTGALATGMGLVGAAAGSIALPLMAGEAVMSVAEKAFFDPYSAIRVGGRNLRDNFTHVMAGDGKQGNTVTGFGLSRSRANEISTNLTRESIKDFMFDTYTMGDLTDFASRSGMLDNTQTDQIEKRMKIIAKQVKVMMRVANEPDFKKAMELLAELKVAGVSESVAGRVLQNLGGSSAIAGVSVQKMMNTVGAQGQFLYQSNNLTPYLGQVHAAQTYGAFSSAYRMGLIGDATLAKFGGREGITQLSMTGQVNSAQTTYNKIRMMNETFGSGSQGGVVSNLSRLGQLVAADPTAAAGAMGLYEHDMVSKNLMERGPGVVLDQLQDIAKVIPGMTNKDGTIDVEKAYLLMTRQMGIPEMEAQAVLKELKVSKSPEALNQSLAALQGNMKRDTIKALDQSGLDSGVLNPITYGAASAWKSVKDVGSQAAGGLAALPAAMGDFLQEKITNARYTHVSEGAMASTYSDFVNGPSSPGKEFNNPWWRSFRDGSYHHGESISKINKLLDKDKDAQTLVDPNATEEQKRTALDNLNADKKLGRILSKDEFSSLLTTLKDTEVVDREVGVSGAKADEVRSNLKKALGTDTDILHGAEVIEASRKLATGQGDKKSEEVLRNTYGKDLSRTELIEKAGEVYRSSAQNGVVHLPSMLVDKSAEELLKAGRKGDSNEFGQYAKDVQKELSRIEKLDTSAETKEKMSGDVVAFYRMKATGGKFDPLLDPSHIPSNFDLSQTSEILSSSRETARQTLQKNSLASQKVINFDTQYSSAAEVKLTQAVENFGGFVKKLDEVSKTFENAVERMPGAKEESSSFWPFGGNEKSSR